MPIYEYRCEACNHELEKIQKMADAPLTDCPACGQARLRKLISAAAFRLKGGGWYETDFKQSNKRNVASDGAESGGSGGESGTGGDSGGSGDSGKNASGESAPATDKGNSGSKDKSEKVA